MPLAYNYGQKLTPGAACTVEDEVFELTIMQEEVAAILAERGTRGLQHFLNDLMLSVCKIEGVDPYLYLTAIDRGNQWERYHDKENGQVIYNLKVDD